MEGENGGNWPAMGTNGIFMDQSMGNAGDVFGMDQALTDLPGDALFGPEMFGAEMLGTGLPMLPQNSAVQPTPPQNPAVHPVQGPPGVMTGVEFSSYPQPQSLQVQPIQYEQYEAPVSVELPTSAVPPDSFGYQASSEMQTQSQIFSELPLQDSLMQEMSPVLVSGYQDMQGMRTEVMTPGLSEPYSSSLPSNRPGGDQLQEMLASVQGNGTTTMDMPVSEEEETNVATNMYKPSDELDRMLEQLCLPDRGAEIERNTNGIERNTNGSYFGGSDGPRRRGRPREGLSHSDGEQREPSTSRSPSRRVSPGPASRFCHICARTQNTARHVVCSNFQRGECRKSMCDRCFTQYGWDWDAATLPETNWTCTHCRDACPPRARCKIYERINNQRRERSRDNQRRDRSRDGGRRRAPSSSPARGPRRPQSLSSPRASLRSPTGSFSSDFASGPPSPM